MDIIFTIRDGICRFFYKKFFKPLAFRQDPEKVHDGIVKFGNFFGKFIIFRRLTGVFFGYKNPVLEQTVFGIKFSNPIGLAAGFDKDAHLTDILPDAGFGFTEIGSVTGRPCAGNPKPRLWRLPASRALVVNYGLKNDGAEIIAKRLRGKKFSIPVGISIAKTNSAETAGTESGVADYVFAAKNLFDIGDYFTINISCPNASGGKPFQEPEKLEKLLAEIKKLNFSKPVFLKISADLDETAVDKILSVADRFNISGFVVANLTRRRTEKIVEKNVPEAGSISGKPVEEDANRLISYIYRKTAKKYVILGVGGIFSAEDAYKKIRLGATLLQLITGMIFEGPQLIGEINRGLARLLRRDGFDDISQAIGADAK
jgi:dihydroorotate dehydrogenase subfamily 2